MIEPLVHLTEDYDRTKTLCGDPLQALQAFLPGEKVRLCPACYREANRQMNQQWVCLFGCTYSGPRDGDHLRTAHPEYWQRRVSMEDRVIVLSNETGQWYWRREDPAGNVLAASLATFADVDEAQKAAVTINAKPYILELRAASGLLPTVDVDALAAEAEAGYGPDQLRPTGGAT